MSVVTIFNVLGLDFAVIAMFFSQKGNWSYFANKSALLWNLFMLLTISLISEKKTENPHLCVLAGFGRFLSDRFSLVLGTANITGCVGYVGFAGCTAIERVISLWILLQKSSCSRLLWWGTGQRSFRLEPKAKTFFIWDTTSPDPATMQFHVNDYEKER